MDEMLVEEKYFKIKASNIKIENQQSLMFKIIDITAEVLLNKEKNNNKLLSVINQLSHMS